MSCIACLTSLTHLELSRTYCSDSLAFNNSLAGLASLSRLCHLDLSHTEVEGSGLEMFCKTVQVSHESLRLMKLCAVPLSSSHMTIVPCWFHSGHNQSSMRLPWRTQHRNISAIEPMLYSG